MGGASAWTFARHLAWPTWGRPQHAWSQQGLGCFQICFHFQFPLLLNHLRAAENKLLSSADLGFLASIVCSLLTLASDHFHPYPPPKGRHRPRIAAGKGGLQGLWPVPTVSYQPVGGSSCRLAFEKGFSVGRSSGPQSPPHTRPCTKPQALLNQGAPRP